MEGLQTGSERSEVETAAYYLWQQRGCPIGSPEVDWFQAEEQMREQHSEPSEPAVIAVAKAMGAALGSVAGIVAFVTNFHPDETPES